MEADQPIGARDHRARLPLPRGQATQTPGISLVLPAYNEQECIRQAITEADDALSSLRADYEIIIVDDGSTDATFSIAENEATHRTAVRVIRQPRNIGYGAALRRGFDAATKELVGFTDADCQFDLRELDRLVLLSRDYDIVCGYRIERQDSWKRKFYSAGYNSLVRMLLGTGVRDCDCALKLFRRETLQSISVDSDGFLFNSELLAKARMAGHSIVEVGVSHRPRFAGESTVSIFHALPVGTSLLRFWWTSILFPQKKPSENALPTRLPTAKEAFGLLSLCLVAAFLLFANLSYPLIEPDESRYAQISLEMFESGNYVTPMLDGQPYLDKPPLLYWMIATSYSVFGVGEFAARFPCALAAWLTVMATFLFGRRLIGQRAAWLGALLLLLCAGYVMSGRFLIMDGLLTLFTTVCLLAAYRGSLDSRAQVRWWILAGVACGFGILTKGPVAAVLCFPPILACYWLTGTLRRLRGRHLLTFIISAAAVSVPWFVLIASAQSEFAVYFFWKHHVLRFVSAFNHQEPWWFYIPVMLIGLFPCSLLFGPLAVYLVSRSEKMRRLRSPEQGFLLLSAVWVVGLFSLSSCKLPTYILPALPPLCLLLGKMLDNKVFSKDSLPYFQKFALVLPKRAMIMFCGIGGVLAVVDIILFRDETLWQAINWGILATAVFCLLLLLRLNLPASRVSWSIATVFALALISFGFDSVMPHIAAKRSIHLQAVRVREASEDPSMPVVYFGHNSHSATMHVAPDKIKRFAASELKQLSQFVQQNPRVVIVTYEREVKKLAQALSPSVELVPAGGRKRRVYVTRIKEPAHLQLGSRKSSKIR